MALQKVSLWVDGSCRNGHLKNKGVMGAGIVAIEREYRAAWSVYLGPGTSQIAELLAVREALIRVRRRPRYHVIIYTDSAYSIGVLKGPWQPKANIQVIDTIKPLINECGKFSMVKVKGHDKDDNNNAAHRLAVAATK